MVSATAQRAEHNGVGWRFDNTYTRLPDMLFAPAAPAAVRAPGVSILNHRLADELGYPPVMLNRLVPELTYRMVEKIFATDFEDWPAMLRAMRETGEEFRQGKIASLLVAQETPGH